MQQLSFSGQITQMLEIWAVGDLWSNGLMVTALDSQSRYPLIKTTRWLQVRLSLSSFWGRSNEYQVFLGVQWLKVNCLLIVTVALTQLNRPHKKGHNFFLKIPSLSDYRIVIMFLSVSNHVCQIRLSQKMFGHLKILPSKHGF